MKTVGARAAAVVGVLVGVVCLGAAARGQAIYIESVQGDLSNNRFAPTPLMVSEGSNQLIGLMAGGNVGGMGIVDRDYYSITVPQGMVLSQMILEEYFSKDPVAFLAIQPGPIFPNDPENTLPEELMGWLHIGVEHLGLDVLPLMGMQGQGFTPPLSAGVYSFWAQQLGAPTDYVLDFVVAPVPGPGVAWVVGGGVVLMSGRRRR